MIISASLSTSVIRLKPATTLPSSSSLLSRVRNSAWFAFQGVNFLYRLEAGHLIRSSSSDDQRPHSLCHFSVQARCPRFLVRRQQIFCQQYLVCFAFDGDDILYRRRLCWLYVDTYRCCYLLHSIALPYPWQSQGLTCVLLASWIVTHHYTGILLSQSWQGENWRAINVHQPFDIYFSAYWSRN